VKSGDDVYILLRLDGRVRKSGKVSTRSMSVQYSTALYITVLSRQWWAYHVTLPLEGGC